MNYLHTPVDVGTGQYVQVTLDGTAANVMVMDDANFNNYRMRGQFKYYGGHFTRSPATVHPPHPGLWNVVVDLGGRQGRVSAAVAVRG